MKILEFKIDKKLYYRGLGHCQVTYRINNSLGQKLIYCLQYQGEQFNPKVLLMRCTQDGEASHEVKVKDGVSINFELPIEHLDPCSDFGKAIHEFIANFNKKGEK